MAVSAFKAHAICDDILQRSGPALIARDFVAFASCFAVPTEVLTFEGARFLTTSEELRVAFEGGCAHFRSSGAQQLIRHIVVAELTDLHTISSTHECRVLGHRIVLLQALYAVHSTLKLMDESWRITRSCYAVEDAPHCERALLQGARHSDAAE